jgi:hypothetical protein
VDLMTFYARMNLPKAQLDQMKELMPANAGAGCFRRRLARAFQQQL